MPLLAIHDFGAAVQLQQRVVGEYNGKQHNMLCALELHPRHINLVGLSAQGIKLFSLQYGSGDLEQSRSAWIPEQLQPVQVLSDIQLALWPPRQVADELPAPWRLIWTDKQRQLFYRDQLYAVVTYQGVDPLETGGQFQLVNHHYHYSLQVQTVEAAAL